MRKEVNKCTRKSYFDYVKNTCLESERQFYGFIKKLRNESVGIQSLREDGELHSGSKKKAKILSNQFKSVFTIEEPMENITDAEGAYEQYPPMPSFVVQQDGVIQLKPSRREECALCITTIGGLVV